MVSMMTRMPSFSADCPMGPRCSENFGPLSFRTPQVPASPRQLFLVANLACASTFYRRKFSGGKANYSPPAKGPDHRGVGSNIEIINERTPRRLGRVLEIESSLASVRRRSKEEILAHTSAVALAVTGPHLTARRRSHSVDEALN
jgi:hypothetical protein